MHKRSIVVWVSVGILAVLGLGVGVYVVPWLLPPPEPAALIAERWTNVQGWATTSADSAAAPTHLRTALQHLKLAGDLRPLLERSGPPRYERPVLGAEAQAAVAALVAWRDNAGGLSEDLCLNPAQPATPELQVFQLWRLAQLAIRAAPSADDPALAAALRVAAQLRQRGGLLHAVMGFGLAEEAAQIAQARGGPTREAFERYRPQKNEVFAVLARESVCSVRLVERAFASPTSEAALAPAGSFWARRLQRLVGPERELQLVKWSLGRQMADAFPLRDDLTALSQSLTAAAARPRPKSAVLGVMAMDWGHLVVRMRDKLESYDRILQLAPIKAPPTGL